MLVLSGLLWLGAATPAVAHAAPMVMAPRKKPPEPAPDPLKEKAQELLTRGNELAAEGDFAAALDKFRAAYELYPSPKLLLNIGTSLRHLGRHAEAIATYEAYEGHPEAEPARLSELRGTMAELELLVGRLSIVVDESDVRLTIDGRLIRGFQHDALLRLDPGEHTVIIEKAGFRPAIERTTVTPKSTTRLELSLRKEGENATDGRRIAGYGLVGAGALTAAVGLIVGAVSIGSTSAVDDDCAEHGEFTGFCDADAPGAADDARAQGIAATVLIVTGAAVGATGTVLLVTERPGASASEAAIRLAPRGAGVALEARW